jgi:hypothetical protein
MFLMWFKKILCVLMWFKNQVVKRNYAIGHKDFNEIHAVV